MALANEQDRQIEAKSIEQTIQTLLQTQITAALALHPMEKPLPLVNIEGGVMTFYQRRDPQLFIQHTQVTSNAILTTLEEHELEINQGKKTRNSYYPEFNEGIVETTYSLQGGTLILHKKDLHTGNPQEPHTTTLTISSTHPSSATS